MEGRVRFPKVNTHKRCVSTMVSEEFVQRMQYLIFLVAVMVSQGSHFRPQLGGSESRLPTVPQCRWDSHSSRADRKEHSYRAIRLCKLPATLNCLGFKPAHTFRDIPHAASQSRPAVTSGTASRIVVPSEDEVLPCSVVAVPVVVVV